MSEILEFLATQINRDEAAARRALPLAAYRTDTLQVYLEHTDSRERVDLTQIMRQPAGTDWLEHVQRWPAGRALIECEVKRQLIAAALKRNEILTDGEWAPEALFEIRALAFSYSGQPNWREEWRP